MDGEWPFGSNVVLSAGRRGEPAEFAGLRLIISVTCRGDFLSELGWGRGWSPIITHTHATRVIIT